jgi:hypothetical protein
LGGRERQPAPTTALVSPYFPNFGHPQVGEQSHNEIQQPPPGPESYAPPYRPSLEEDSASLSGESLDGHLQGECALEHLSLLWEAVEVGRVDCRNEPGVNCLEQGWEAWLDGDRGAYGNDCRLRVGIVGSSP